MKRPFVLFLSVLLVATSFAAGVSAPQILNVIVTNFPLDSHGNLRVAEQDTRPVNINVTIEQLLASERIVVFDGNMIRLGYTINQTGNFAGCCGSSISLQRNYQNPQSTNLFIFQYARIFTDQQAEMVIQVLNARNGFSASQVRTIDPPFTSIGIDVLLAATAGLNDVTYTFTINVPGFRQGKVELLGTPSSLDNPATRIALKNLDATGFRKLTLHAAFGELNFTLQQPELRASVLDSFTETSFDLQRISSSSCTPALGLICVRLAPPTFAIEPPFSVQVGVEGIADILGLKIVAYIWN